MGFERPKPIALPQEAVMPVVSKPSDYLKLYTKVMWRDHKPRVILGFIALVMSVLYLLFFGTDLAWLIPWAFGAWVAPSTRSTGDLITAAIWNQDVVTNVQYLADNFAYVIQDNTQHTVDISAGAGDLWQITVPADALGTDGVLVMFGWAEVTGALGGGDHDFSLIYGATTLDSNNNFGNVDANDLMYFSAMLVAADADNAQRGAAQLCERHVTDDDTGDAVVGFVGTAAEDSTGDLVFKLRWTAGTSGELTVLGTTAYVIGAGAH